MMVPMEDRPAMTASSVMANLRFAKGLMNCLKLKLRGVDGWGDGLVACCDIGGDESDLVCSTGDGAILMSEASMGLSVSIYVLIDVI